jgi:alpha-galactosidase
MRKIVFIGGGSAKFVRTIAVDLFLLEELKDSHITLMDIDKERLELSERLLKKIIKEMGVPAKCDATTNRRKALEGADYVIITVMVGGFDKYLSDVQIPAKYGVLQSISDTTGPGALMRIVRTAPVLQGIAAELKELAPNAWILNYANPMSMNTWTLLRSGHSKTVGLCHSIQGCPGWRFAKWLGIPGEEIEYTAGGINHMDFYLTLTHKGKDLYPDLLKCEKKAVKEYPSEKVAFEICKYLGHFPAEGTDHQSEYSAWFMKNRETAKKYSVEIGLGHKNDSAYAKVKIAEAKDILAGKAKLEFTKSLEYGSEIIHSMETGKALEIYGNVKNTGLIENLPPGCVVEVPCLVAKNSIKPCHVGKIPPQLAAYMTPHIFLHELAMDAVFNKDKTALRRALQADPLTGAILTLPQIEKMLSELCAANKEYMKGW